MTKILYSPGYGAGWWTWNQYQRSRLPDFDQAAYRKFVLTCHYLVEALEIGHKFPDDSILNNIEFDRACDEDPYLSKFMSDLKNLFGVENFCLRGVSQLKVLKVNGLFKIDVLDGAESVEEYRDPRLIYLG